MFQFLISHQLCPYQPHLKTSHSSWLPPTTSPLSSPRMPFLCLACLPSFSSGCHSFQPLIPLITEHPRRWESPFINFRDRRYIVFTTLTKNNYLDDVCLISKSVRACMRFSQRVSHTEVALRKYWLHGYLDFCLIMCFCRAVIFMTLVGLAMVFLAVKPKAQAPEGKTDKLIFIIIKKVLCFKGHYQKNEKL